MTAISYCFKKNHKNSKTHPQNNKNYKKNLNYAKKNYPINKIMKKNF